MKQELEIYCSQKRLDQSVERLRNSQTIEENKLTILKFKQYLGLEGINVLRIARYIEVLKDMSRILKKDFNNASKEDIIQLAVTLNETKKATWTKVTYKKMLKRFYKWLKNTGDEYPEEVKWLKAGMKKSERRLPSNQDLITEKEIEKLVDTAESSRDKAFISILYETGSRIGEIGSLQLKNIKVDAYGAILDVEGKTGCRSVRIISSTPYLMTWLQNHPLKNNPNAPLWTNTGPKKHNQQLQYQNMRHLIREVFRKAGINKKCNPHIFRHSRATFLANHLTEFQMNHYLGWVQGSGMPSTYIHLSGKNLDNSILALNGIKTESRNNETELKPQTCPRCNTINTHDAKYCKNCAGVLNVQAAQELEQKQKNNQLSDQILKKIMELPQIQEILKGTQIQL
jgi:integrase/ribosomal protein L40E